TSKPSSQPNQVEAVTTSPTQASIGQASEVSKGSTPTSPTQASIGQASEISKGSTPPSQSTTPTQVETSKPSSQPNQVEAVTTSPTQASIGQASEVSKGS
ncbi:unnamed protein product, partial [Musa hybrid cultivar]